MLKPLSLSLSIILTLNFVFMAIGHAWILLQLGGPSMEMKTGRRDSKESYATMVEAYLPDHNDSLSLALSRFQSIGIDVEGTVALLGTSFFVLHSFITGVGIYINSVKYRPTLKFL